MPGATKFRFDILAWSALLTTCGAVAANHLAAAVVGTQPAAALDDQSATDADNARYQQFALTHPGDADRGREIFRDEAVTKCAVCHRAAGQGGDVGPELSAIGGKFDRPHLIESLLEPSRQIVEGFRSSLFIMKDGRVITGIIKVQSDDRIKIVDAAGRSSILNRADIEQQQDQTVSLMPEGLAKQINQQQFVDLIAYMETLRPGGKPQPGAGVTGPIQFPEGFNVQVIATHLTGCTALETVADGRILLCEQTGALRMVKNGRLLPTPVLRVTVDSFWERGLIGVTVDPDFERNQFLYVCYVAPKPYPHHRISRFTMNGDVAVAGSEKILFVGDDQRQLGGNVPAGHQGGALHFGGDGKLYIAIGEQTAGQPSQRLDSLLGKILRIDPDGSIPTDNPFVHQTTGKYRAIWARGLRNPFTFAIHTRTGVMLINDVGGKFEEVNRGMAGANFGWPTVEHGPTKDARFVGPVHWYPQASVAGGDFAPDDLDWPGQYHEKYFFADFVHGWIKVLDPLQPDQVETFATGLTRPVDLRFAPDGSLYVLLRNAWVIDGKFEAGTGSLLRIAPAP